VALAASKEHVSKDEPGLFGRALALLDEGAVTLASKGERVAPGSLALADFHVLRAVLTKHGLVPEEPIEIECRNCGARIEVRPCASLETAPWVDGELGDEELDTTLPFGEPIEVPPLPLGRVRSATSVTFAPRTVDEARPLFVALAKPKIDVTPEVVRAMGIVSLGKETDPEKIAEALTACDDDAFAAVGEAFLDSHYPARLAAVVFCEACNARNDVDAPYDRELDRARDLRGEAAADASSFPSFDAFAARARVIARPMLAEAPGEPIELVVEGGTPAVDDGGEPLLGSYLPPHPGDIGHPTRPPSITVYFRTFEAMWREDGPYDWEDELAETIEHELEHHVYFLRGDDPMDDDERDVIRREAVRVVGKKEAARRVMKGFGGSLGDFFVRTWPIWIIALAALALMLATQR
jgi:hypothetical protein